MRSRRITRVLSFGYVGGVRIVGTAHDKSRDTVGELPAI